MAGLPNSAPTLNRIYDTLEALHGHREWHWAPDTDPFEIIVGAILVQNTAWTNVEHALTNLRAADSLSYDAFRRMPEDALRERIRPSGQYRQKTKKLRTFIDLADDHGGVDELLALPGDRLRAELLSTWGIGPETADVIVLYASRQPSFVIDAYTRRLFGRLGEGPDETDGYDVWRRFFEERLAPDVERWGRFHSLIVMHCKSLCLKRRPRCGECDFSTVCPGATRDG